MFKKNVKRYIIITVVLLNFLLVNSTMARYIGGQTGDDLQNQMEEAGKIGYGGAQPTPNSLAELVATIIKAFLGLLGIIFVVLIIYAGYGWMTAAGDEEKVNKAKNTLKQAVIGLIIIIAAYAITFFIFSNLPGGPSGGGGGGSPPYP